MANNTKDMVTYTVQGDEGNQELSDDEIHTHHRLDELGLASPREAFELPKPVKIPEIIGAQLSDENCRDRWAGKRNRTYGPQRQTSWCYGDGLMIVE